MVHDARTIAGLVEGVESRLGGSRGEERREIEGVPAGWPVTYKA